MPYASNADLPAAVRSKLPSEAQDVFRRVFNGEKDKSHPDERAFATAWTAVKNGWSQGAAGEWTRKEPKAKKALSFSEALVRKDQPGADDVHVASASSEPVPKRRTARTFNEVVNGARPGSGPAFRTTKVETPASLYVHRPVTNGADLHAWAKGAGIDNLVPPEEMHVTQVYSRAPVKLAPKGGTVEVGPEARKIAPLGDKGAVVMHISSPELQERFDEAAAAGASWDYPGGYKPHVTLSYDAGNADLSKIEPPTFALQLGPEVHAPINEDWAEEKGFRLASTAKVCKVNEELGLVFGYAIVCKIDGQDYYDLNVDPDGQSVPEHIPEQAMLKAAADFMAKASRPGNEMHAGPDSGEYVFAFPLTTDIAKALGITCEKTGLLIGYKPEPDVLCKYRDGTYTGFSIEGVRIRNEEIAA